VSEESLVPETAVPSESAGAQMTFWALVVAFFFFVRKFAGLIKEHLLARFFGAGPATDAFKVIYNSIIFNVYARAEQLLRPAYLPEFVRQREQEEGRGWRLLGTMASLVVVAHLLLVSALLVFARPLIRLMWPDLAANPQAFELATLLLWMMAPALVFYSLSLLPELTLHAYKRFTLPAIAEACYNLLVVGVLFVGVEILWHPGHPRAILAAGLGVAVGGVSRLLIMLPGLRPKFHLLRFSLALRRVPGTLVVLGLMPPLVLGIATGALRPLVDSMVCTRLGEGMYAALDFGRKLSDAGIMILPLAVSLVVYPYVTEWAAAGDRQRMSDSLLWMTRALAFLFVPFSLGMVLLAEPLVRLVYDYQEFKEADVSKVTLALMCYASGLFVYAVEGSINKWYFALKDTWTPNWVGALWAGAHFVISVGGGLYTSLGLAAVALAYPLTKAGKVLMLYVMIRPRLEPIPGRQVYPFLGKLLLASGIMGACVWWLGWALEPRVEAWHPPLAPKLLRLLVLTGVPGGAGMVVFLALAWALHIEEVAQVWKWLRGKLKRVLRRGR